jgi:site-specific recombinase XerD
MALGNKDGGVGKGIADAFSLERCFARVEIAERLQGAGTLCLRVSSSQGQETTGPCCCSQTQDPAGICGGRHNVGWHTFRHTVGTMLAEMGEHQLTIRDYLRHSNLHVTNKYL